MVFKDFRINVIIRTIGLCLSIYTFVTVNGPISMAFLGLLIIYQVIELINLMENTNKEMITFLNSIKYDDFSQSYTLKGKGKSFTELNNQFNNVFERFREIRAEKEAEYQYLKNIIQHIGIGIISFDKNGNIQMINTSAKRILRSPSIKNINELNEFSSELVHGLNELTTGANALIKIRHNGEQVHLAIYIIELFLKGEEYKLVTIQNIQSELDNNEMDAWQNLIRVLTHEIMNSVTPISSMAGTVDSELDYYKEQKTLPSTDDLDDIHLAIQTIKRRSEGLIRFVDEFRSLTHVPTPKLSHVPVKELFQQIKLLMGNQFNTDQIELKVIIDPENLLITVDSALVEQVLINLLKNAGQALKEKQRNITFLPSITLKAILSPQTRPIIIVEDNGPGIDQEALDRIFIPFYTTKKDGSGIGLSLSRQIMRQHNGTISASSTLEKGTQFFLKF